MSAGPTQHRQLVDLACNEPYGRIEDALVAAARESASKVGKLVYQAYTEGLRDGFVQGIEAAKTTALTPSDRHEGHDQQEARP